MKIKSVRCTIERNSGHTQRNVEIPFDAFAYHVDLLRFDSNGWSQEKWEQIKKEFPLPKEGY